MLITYDELLAKMKDIHDRKNKDYGNSAHDTYAKYGLVSYLTRMDDKMNRITSLYKNKEQLVDDEKITDTLIDLANYAVMAVEDLSRGSEG